MGMMVLYVGLLRCRINSVQTNPVLDVQGLLAAGSRGLSVFLWMQVVGQSQVGR